MRVLLVGWFSFTHGEATAGDVAAAEAVARRLARAGIACDTAWSPFFRSSGPSLEEADPARYSHLVFACGPLHGPQVRWLHERFAACRRIAVGVSVIDPADPAVTGFDAVLPRDRADGPPHRDLATAAPLAPVPVVGVAMVDRQPEYGTRGQHERVGRIVTSWVAGRDCAPLSVSTRLDTRDWRQCGTPSQLAALLGRCDLVVTTRLHGLVFALRSGVPAIAVDPVDGGAKVTAQARVLDWPAVVPAGTEEDMLALLDRLWDWCLSPEGRRRAARHADPQAHAEEGGAEETLTRMLEQLGARPSPNVPGRV
ncbi:polysaccharide pyruvyl transferase family protein [Thermobifida halotolerans]|uniref:Polysaccharide pyruvyl transferase family protein n=1 Tax=Thermobifida halotolerans TaxID=483545 RepID=A0A399G5S3_9ACTN|nr:polysaccharide pyruvyl transferase family protein [Thermobifida halotolerans]UOE21001.1 polysaccharide pyruvyl transferase family protein [Thermobifida halotolerans]